MTAAVLDLLRDQFQATFLAASTLQRDDAHPQRRRVESGTCCLPRARASQLTGAVFPLEVLAIGRMSYRARIPCLLASLIGDGMVAA